MKNSFLDIINVYNTDKQATCTFEEVNDTYYVFVAKEWFFKQYIRDIVRLKNENRILVYINTIVINPMDYDIEELGNGINVKFKKSNFPYALDNTDIIHISADVEFRG